MKPREKSPEVQRELLRTELLVLVNMSHPMVRLAKSINWGFVINRSGRRNMSGWDS